MGWSGDWRGEAVKAAECRSMEDSASIVEVQQKLKPSSDIDEELLYTPDRKSFVWQHFKLHRSETDNKAYCNVCKAAISHASGNTSNLSKHLKRKHQTEEPRKEPKLPKWQQTLPNILSANRPYGADSREQQVLEDVTTYCIYKDLEPLSLVEKEGFRTLVNHLNPRFQLPSRKVLTKTTLPRHLERQSKALAELIRTGQSVACTTDGWTSRTTHSYCTITVHVLDKNWEIHNHVIETKHTPESHTAEYLSDGLKRAVEKWELVNSDRKSTELYFTTDNASNIIKAVKLAEYGSMRCYAHTLNLSVQKCLQHLSVNNVVKRVRRIVTYFHKSGIGTATLAEKQKLLGISQHKLIQDVATRWNSCYDMLHRFDEQKSAIRLALESLKDSKYTGAGELLYHLNALSQTDDMTELIELLKPFKNVTVLLSAHSYPAISLVHPTHHKLIGNMSPCEADSPFIALLKQILLADLSSRNLELDNFLAQCAYLDPRFKAMPYLSSSARKDIRDQVLTLTVALHRNHLRSAGLTEVEKNHGTDAASQGEADKAQTTATESLFGDMFEVNPEDTTQVEKDDGIEVAVGSELLQYDKSRSESLTQCPLKWWKSNQSAYPYLSRLAARMLIIQATSVPSERLFSTAGEVVNAKRSCLLPENVDMLIFLNKNHIFTKPDQKKGQNCVVDRESHT